MMAEMELLKALVQLVAIFARQAGKTEEELREMLKESLQGVVERDPSKLPEV